MSEYGNTQQMQDSAENSPVDLRCIYTNFGIYYEEKEMLRRVGELEDEIYWMDHEGGKMRRKEFDRQDGWTKHLSFVDRPGEFYWYNLETGECVWDDWSGDVNEPNWWV